LELFGEELVAIDGSKFGAVNIPKRNFTEKKLRRMLKEVEVSITFRSWSITRGL
jgi:hypothetical protein